MCSVSLITFNTAQTYLKILYTLLVVITVVCSIVTLVLKNSGEARWEKISTVISLTLSVVSALLFIIGLQPYAAVFTFVILVIKALALIKLL